MLKERWKWKAAIYKPQGQCRFHWRQSSNSVNHASAVNFWNVLWVNHLCESLCSSKVVAFVNFIYFIIEHSNHVSANARVGGHGGVCPIAVDERWRIKSTDWWRGRIQWFFQSASAGKSLFWTHWNIVLRFSVLTRWCNGGDTMTMYLVRSSSVDLGNSISRGLCLMSSLFFSFVDY